MKTRPSLLSAGTCRNGSRRSRRHRFQDTRGRSDRDDRTFKGRKISFEVRTGQQENLLYRNQLQVFTTCSRRCRLRLDRHPSCVLHGRHHHRTGRPAPALLPPSYIHEQSVQVGHTGSKPTKKGRLNFKSFYNTSVVPLLNKAAPLGDK
jgi:hypothetical protein